MSVDVLSVACKDELFEEFYSDVISAAKEFSGTVQQLVQDVLGNASESYKSLVDFVFVVSRGIEQALCEQESNLVKPGFIDVFRKIKLDLRIRLAYQYGVILADTK